MPEGAISIEEIETIYLTRLLEDGGADDLVPVLSAFARGHILEEQGKYKEAAKLYRESLRHNPGNPWIAESMQRVKHTLN